MKTFFKTVLPILIAVALTIIIGVNAMNNTLAMLKDMMGPDYNPSPNPNPNPDPDGNDEYYVNFWIDKVEYGFELTECYARVKINDNFVMPDNPYREGYNFDGWYYDKDSWNNLLDVNELWREPPTHDLDVYAHFVKWTDSEEPDPTPQAPAELIFEPYTGTPYYAVVGITDGDMTEITIPDEYNYKKVVAICAGAFQGRTGIQKVRMSDNIEHIESSAFEGCNGITYVDFSYGLKTIGDRAFWGCKRLYDVLITGELTTIGAGAFGECCIGSLTLPETLTSVDDKAFEGAVLNNHVCVPPVALYSLPKDAIVTLVVWGPGEITTSFNNLQRLESVTVRGGVTKIGANAFIGCTALTRLVLVDDLASIGANAFKGCTALTSVTFPEALTEIGQRAFSGCTGLSEVVLGENVATLGGYVFENCTGLKTSFCYANTKPSGWVATWKKGCDATVVWGHR